MTHDTLRAAAEAMARRFHEAYERLAPEFGYTTREETREFDPESANGRLMIAVCAALSQEPPAAAPAQGEQAEPTEIRCPKCEMLVLSNCGSTCPVPDRWPHPPAEGSQTK